MRWVIVLIATSMAGCAAHDQRMATSFQPTADGGWTYTTFADAAQPLESASAEAYRMEMLEIWLAENNLCQAGYAVESRTPLKRSSGMIGDIYDVHYRIRCS